MCQGEFRQRSFLTGWTSWHRHYNSEWTRISYGYSFTTNSITCFGGDGVSVSGLSGVFAKELGFDKVVMEGDSEKTIWTVLTWVMYCKILSFCFLAFPLFQLSTFIGKGIVLPTNLLDGLSEILFLFRWSLFLKMFLMFINLIF